MSRRSRLKSQASSLLVVAFCFLTSGFAQGTLTKPPSIVLVTVDTLRSDYLGCYGNKQIATPNMDSLAAEGVRFENAYCQVPLTPPSHASIFTGLYPPSHGVRDFSGTGLRPDTPTLAAVLKSKGYSTAAFVSAYVLDSVWGLSRGFDLYYDEFELASTPEINPGNIQRKAGDTIDLVLKWGAKEPATPFFLWVHLYDPHHDYNPPSPFMERYPQDLYGGEVAYVDQELGRLLAWMKRSSGTSLVTPKRDASGSRGGFHSQDSSQKAQDSGLTSQVFSLYDESIIVLLSDHGEALGEHGESEHGFFLYETTARIPFIIKPPKSQKLQPRTVTSLAQTVDVLPTLLQLGGLSFARDVVVEGRSLLGAMLGKPLSTTPVAYSETTYPLTTFGWSDLAALREGRYKYIQAPRPELYDLNADPHETKNLFATAGALARQLDSKLATLKRRLEKPAPRKDERPAPEAVEALRSLGYVGAGVRAGSSSARRGNLADPKDKVSVYNQILLALQASEAGRVERSNDLLRQVLQDEAGLFIVHYSMGLNYLKAAKLEAALSALQTAYRLKPDFELTQINMARALTRLGRTAEAIEILRGVLAKNPSRLQVKRQLAALLNRTNRHQEAASLFREIVHAHPNDREANKMLGVSLAELENYSEALTVLQKALALGSNDALLRNFLGIALANTGRLEEATENYRKALEKHADYQPARLNLALTLLKLGKREEAVTQYKVVCKASRQLCEKYAHLFR